MKVVVFGASGKTGREIVTQALEKGHEVTAVVREPGSMAALTNARLRVIKGDATNAGSFKDALRNQDAVVSALGISSFWKSLQPMSFHRETAHIITEQMLREKVERLICMTSVGVMQNPGAPFWYNTLVQPLLRHKYEDMRQMEQIVRKSGLQWTIVRPFRLINGKRTGVYRIAAEESLPDASSISRADVADLLLKELERKDHLRQAIAVGY